MGDEALGAVPPFLFVAHLLQIVVILVVLRFLDVYEREPYPLILGLFAWGALVATTLSLVGNAVVEASLPDDVAAVFGPAISAPLAEEITKGVALVVAVVASHRLAQRWGTARFQGVADGIVYGAAVGLGFAFTENLLYFFLSLGRAGELQAAVDVFLLRVDFFGVAVLLHAVYTGLFGAGLGLATWVAGRGARLALSLGGLAAGMALHALWNGLPMLTVVNRYGFEATADGLAGRPTTVDLVGFEQALDDGLAMAQALHGMALLAVAAAFVAWLRTERHIIRAQLRPEVDDGVLTEGEWQALPRFWRRLGGYWRQLNEHGVGYANMASRREDALVRLALRKWRAERLGDDHGEVERMRRRVRATGAYLDTFADGG